METVESKPRLGTLVAISFGLLLLLGSLFVAGSALAGQSSGHQHHAGAQPPASFLDASHIGPSSVITVEMGDNFFAPTVVTITAGDTVVWHNGGNFFHNVRADSSTGPLGYTQPQDFLTDFAAPESNVGQPHSVQHTFYRPGRYYYWCDPHAPDMAGIVDVLPQVVPVAIGNNFFSPNVVTITAGTVVSWTNPTSNARSHTVTSTTPPGILNSGTLAAGNVYTHAFATAGTYQYQCDFHAGMAGTVVVIDPPTPTPTPGPTNTRAASSPTATTAAATPTATAAAGSATATPGGATATPCTVSFTDVPSGYIFYNEIQYLACRGVLSGYPNPNPPGGNSFLPNNNTARGQFAKIAALGFGLPAFTPTGSQTFVDVAPGSIFYGYVETAAHVGAVNGLAASQCAALGTPGNCYGPNVLISRVQVALIVQRVRQYAVVTPTQPTFRDLAANSFGYAAVETLANRGIINGAACSSGGGTCFRPNDNVKRGELSKIVKRAIDSAP